MSKLRKMKNNPNKGTKGNDYIARSLQELGAARSIVATADGEVIAGNHVLEQAEKLGIPTRVVQTDGTELVVVQRTDVESGSDKAMAIAVADNKASELNLKWDNFVLSSLPSDIAENWGQIDNELLDNNIDLQDAPSEKQPLRTCPHCGMPLKLNKI